MSKKKNRWTSNKIRLVSILSLIVLIALSAVINIFWRPISNIVFYVKNSTDKVIEEIEKIPFDDDMINKLRVVEDKYGVFIESVMPDGSVSYSTFSNEIYLPEKYSDKLTNKENISKKPIEDTVKIESGSEEKIRFNNDLTKVQVLNTESEHILYETKLKDGCFPEENTLKIYFGTYEYYTTLIESGVHRVIVISILMFLVWLLFNSVLLRIFSKINKMNIAVEKMEDLNFSEKCPEDSGEIGSLGRNINLFAKNAESKIEELTIENENLSKKLDAKLRMEDEKKDFLANAAHEMKTPIAIIQGYAEGLKMGIAKGGRARQEYCNIIMDETTKMNKLVIELLELSKYRQKMYEDVKEENFSIRSFVQGIINSMDPILKENSIDIENAINRKYIGRTDIEKANLVLNNYISNAISHTNMYKKIVISCEEKANAYRINVFNSGDHISEENMKNIWDSFYRVDKSHSRSEGRFGIGLSIVETIQNALKMDYGVDNVYGGVQFWFDVKKPSSDEQKGK